MSASPTSPLVDKSNATTDMQNEGEGLHSQVHTPMVEDDSSSVMMVSSPEGKRYDNNYDDDTNTMEEIPAAKFLPDQRVFATDKGDGNATTTTNGNIYEAVIRKASYNSTDGNGGWTYLVHYSGWNARWDKWLLEADIVPDSQEARDRYTLQQQQREQERQKQILQQQEQERNDNINKNKKDKRKPTSSSGDRKRKKTINTDESSGAAASSSRNNKRRGTTTEAQGWSTFFEDCCELPFTLKTILVEDRERMLRKGFDSLYNGYDHNMEKGSKWRPARDVHHLPAAVTIRTVLNHYVKIKRKEAAADAEKAAAAESKARSFVDGLATLFDKTLPVWLLYQPERAQHLAIEADPTLQKIRKCDLYGCEHLLRFLVRLPLLLAEAPPPTDKKETGKQLADLIVLLQKNRQACFKAKYREPKYEEFNDWEKALRDGNTNIVTSSSMDDETAAAPLQE